MKRLAIIFYFTIVLLGSILIIVFEHKGLLLPIACAYGFYYASSKSAFWMSCWMTLCLLLLDIVVYMIV